GKRTRERRAALAEDFEEHAEAAASAIDLALDHRRGDELGLGLSTRPDALEMFEPARDAGRDLRQPLVDSLKVLGRRSIRDVLRTQTDPAWCQRARRCARAVTAMRFASRNSVVTTLAMDLLRWELVLSGRAHIRIARAG